MPGSTVRCGGAQRTALAPPLLGHLLHPGGDRKRMFVVAHAAGSLTTFTLMQVELSKPGDQGEGGSRAQRGGTPPATASTSACHLFHAARSQPPTHIRDGGREQPVAQLLTEHSRRRSRVVASLCWLQTRGFVRAVNVSAFSADSVRLWTAQQAPPSAKAPPARPLLTVLSRARAAAGGPIG
jgi:hypothetical protein